MVVAAGNYGRDDSAGTNGYGTITAPGNDPYVITVGAMKTMGTADAHGRRDRQLQFQGSTANRPVVKPDLVAPGNQIISLYTLSDTLYGNNPGNEVPYTLLHDQRPHTALTSYFMLSGTSMAAPMVSGAAALMLQQNPTLTPDQVKARLMKTAYKGMVQSSTATDPPRAKPSASRPTSLR